MAGERVTLFECHRAIDIDDLIVDDSEHMTGKVELYQVAIVRDELPAWLQHDVVVYNVKHD